MKASMRYVLTGFTHSTGFRVFAFDGVTEHWVRTSYSVRADLALSRKHGIHMQELPLLCRAVLDRRSEGDDQRAFTFTEDDMTIHSNAMSAAAESRKKKPWRKPAAEAES
jgi:hypothetical protein